MLEILGVIRVFSEEKSFEVALTVTQNNLQEDINRHTAKNKDNKAEQRDNQRCWRK